MCHDGGMDTIFAPNDPFYTTVAVTWAVVNYVILPRILPWSVRRWLNVPAMLIHEFAHWLVAYGMVGFPRVNFREGVDKDGAPTVAYVRWHTGLFGWIGNAVISIAPFAGGLALAWYIATYQFTVEQPFWHGIGLIVLFCWCIEAANMISNSDFNGLTIIGKVVFLYFVLFLFLVGLSLWAVWCTEILWPLVEPHFVEWLNQQDAVEFAPIKEMFRNRGF